MNILVSYNVDKEVTISLSKEAQERIERYCSYGIEEGALELIILDIFKEENTIANLEDVKLSKIKDVKVCNLSLCGIINSFVPCCLQYKKEATFNFCPICGKSYSETVDNVFNDCLVT